MIGKIPFKLYVLFCLVFTLCLTSGFAQESRSYDDGIRIGASINYCGMYFGNDGNFLNDIWNSSVGYQLHVLYGFRLSSLFSISTGAVMFVNRYSLEKQQTPETNHLGEPTGNHITFFMSGYAGTSYLGLPVNFNIRPFGNKSFYALAGAEVSYKIAYSNGTMKSFYETEDGNRIELHSDDYDTPERSNDVLIFLNVGVGYSFDSNLIPLNIEIGARQALTPYMNGENIITSWIRSFSVSASYRF